MADNNSSAFNYRLVYGTNHVSNHSFGLAIDINPRQNPYIAIDGKIFPEGAEYNIKMPGTLVAGDKVVSLFESKGWEWSKGYARMSLLVKTILLSNGLRTSYFSRLG